jgi:DNA-directed RNA polymerase specialized sigma24 family protein
MDTIPGALEMAFRTALLLTGATRTAEAAVMHGIRACEVLSHRGLLIESVRSAILRRKKGADTPDAIDVLPPELRRIFMLQPLLRDCLVLRILVGLSPAFCAALLDISIAEFENALCAALNQLPLLASFKATRYAQKSD